MNGMTRWVNPAPALPHPAPKALADPTTLTLNMTEDQNWQDTNVAREKPMHIRTTMNPAALVTTAMHIVAAAVRSWRKACPKRGPNVSHTAPRHRREKMAPVTDAMAAPDTSDLVRSRHSRMTGIKGGTEKVAKKARKKEIHETWKAKWCGCPQYQSFSTLDLCSESTGTLKVLTSSNPDAAVSIFGDPLSLMTPTDGRIATRSWVGQSTQAGVDCRSVVMLEPSGLRIENKMWREALIEGYIDRIERL
mmetsp:Transcript_6197/g.17137  ORF Transcript_6197/g.17137 Transcript_6197/m.17137 type:complete len:249 (-) Transcript_6197:52-798(-)